MPPSYTGCEMISAILSNLLWAKSLIAPCFYCFIVNVLKDFLEIAVAREKVSLIPLNTMSSGRSTPLTNAAMETHLVTTVDIIRPVSMMIEMYWIVLSFLPAGYKLQLHQANLPQILLIFSSNILVAFVKWQYLDLDNSFLRHCPIYS